jgi:glycosyltransferase involved in cell wall biosynthesis
MPETVLVVTPSLNQGAYIRQAIESVLGQDYPWLTYWVVDGGSSDGTRRTLLEFDGQPRFHWISEPDRGPAHAISKGFSRSQADVLAWLSADDLYAPGAVRTALEALRQNPGAVMVSGAVDLIDAQGVPRGSLAQSELSLYDMLKLRRFLPQPGVFFRQQAYQEAGGLDEMLEFAFDLDLFLRLRRLGQVCYRSSVFAFHRLHARSKTVSQHPLLRHEAAHVARRFIASSDIIGIERRELLSRVDIVEAYAAFQRRSWLLFSWHLARGLVRYPAHLPLLFDRAMELRNGAPDFWIQET